MTSGDTKYADLNTNLSAVGKAVFVNFYYDFKDTSLSDEDLAQKIFTQNPTSRSSNQNFRIPRARHIFKSGLQIDALKIIISSDRVDFNARNKARQILAQEIQSLQYAIEGREERVFLAEFNQNVICLPSGADVPFTYDNTPRPPRAPRSNTSSQYSRDRIVSENALRLANHMCEADNSHFVFRRKNGNTNYTEPHHLVPLSASKDFPDVDLDREQNVVSLCSNCHNLLHYGADIDGLLTLLYNQRKELLAAVGIVLTYDQLRKYY